MVRGAVSSATGGTGRAATEVGETLILNPATIVHSSSFDSYFFYANGDRTADLKEQTYAVSLTDNNEDSFLPGSVTYAQRKRTFSGIGSIDEQFAQVTLAKFATKHFSVGMAVTYLSQDYLSGYKQWNGNLGVMYNPTSQLGIGLSALNIISPSDDIPLFLQEKTNIGFGLVYLFEKFLKLRADVAAHDGEDDWEPEYMLGVESLMGQFGVFRLGWNKSELTGYKYYSIGLGFDGPRFKIDYSYQQKDRHRRGAMHSVDLRITL